MGWRSLSHKETDLNQEGSGFKTESPPRSSPPNTITRGIRFQPVKIQEHKHSDHNMTLHAQRYASFIFLFLKFTFRASLFPSQYFLACWEMAEKEASHTTLRSPAITKQGKQGRGKWGGEGAKGLQSQPPSPLTLGLLSL